MTTKEKYKLSVIIVNYNVEYFLDQCLESVKKATDGISIEVIIVDNNSVDGSLEMLAAKYPDYTLIANKENVGFSSANNQAIRASSGEYVLLLNPDTVVGEDTFLKTIDFMESHVECGGLGVRMIDGTGEFLPESKRGLPRPLVAFYKIFGLSNLFPKSKRFGQYHLGHLSEFDTNEIDILSGAFMMMRKSCLDQVGLLDENFFMYGEDIDLSYRITQGGFKNYYFPGTTIIHYKGESTKKSSVNYVFVFYRAMIIFANKHFSGKNARLYSVLINLAIYLRAFMALCLRFVKRLFLPAIDFIYVVGGLFALTNYWKMSAIEFPEELIQYSIPIYAATWLASSYFNGGYDYPIKLFKLFKGVILGTIIILLTYAVLPKSLQFSRLFIFVGAAWVLFYYIVSRVFLHFVSKRRFNLKINAKKRFAIIGGKKEYERVRILLNQMNKNILIISQLSHNEMEKKNIEKFDELIFCSGDYSNVQIIEWMSKYRNFDIDFKIAPKGSDHLIGSSSIDTAGELYILNINTLVSKENKRKKRLFDLIFSFLLLLISPFIIFMFDRKINLLKNLFNVLLGKRSFIGFSDEVAKKDIRLPRIKEGILSPGDGIDIHNSVVHDKLNLLYSRDYSMRKDFSILLRAWFKLDK